MSDLRQDAKYADYMTLLDWKVIKLEGAYFYLKKLPLIGYICKLQRPEKLLKLKQLNKLTKQERVFAIYLEPKNEEHATIYEKKLRFKRTKSASLATKTVKINLTKEKDAMLSEMHYKTRYNIKLAGRLGVKIKKSTDAVKFAKFWQKCARQRGMFLPMKREIAAIYQAFGKDAQIYNAYWQNKKVAAVLTVATKDCVYYMYAASNSEGKKCFAPTALVWDIILDAKKRGYKYFDFEGIYDERYPLKSWKGFTRFKKSFGGQEVEFPGILKKYINPFGNGIK